MLAGLPKAPSAYNPVVNPKRARTRQQYILQRMHTLGYITDAQFEAAKVEPLKIKTDSAEFGVHAEYVAEMARQLVYEQFKEETYTRGLNVFTTVTKADQDAAYLALRRGVMDYEKRHAYRGPEAYIDIPAAKEEADEAIETELAEHPDSDDIIAAMVLQRHPGRHHRGHRVGRRDQDQRRRPRLRQGLAVREGGAEPARQARRGDPRHAGRRLDLERHPDAGDRIGLRRRRHHRRRDPRAGRRLRLQPQQVQPRDPGLAPAGLLVQAVHLLGLARARAVAGHHHQRRADLVRRRPDRRPGLGAEELRRQVRRPDDHAQGPDQVEEHDLDPHPATRSAPSTARNTPPASASTPTRTRPT